MAERSKVAADEINDLSGHSLKVTEDAGELMGRIIPEIEKTAKLVQEISAASMEQNSGADQINGAIQQLNNVTQQNSAASEEIATGSEELASQSEQLSDIISFFKLKEVNVYKNNLQKKQTRFTEHKKSSTASQKADHSYKGVNIKLDSRDRLDSEYETF